MWSLCLLVKYLINFQKFEGREISHRRATSWCSKCKYCVTQWHTVYINKEVNSWSLCIPATGGKCPYTTGTSLQQAPLNNRHLSIRATSQQQPFPTMVTALERPRIFIPMKKFALILTSHQGPPLYNGQSTLSPVPRVAVVERFRCSDNFNGDWKPQTLRTSVLCLLVFSPTISQGCCSKAVFTVTGWKRKSR